MNRTLLALLLFAFAGLPARAISLLTLEGANSTYVGNQTLTFDSENTRYAVNYSPLLPRFVSFTFLDPTQSGNALWSITLGAPAGSGFVAGNSYSGANGLSFFNQGTAIGMASIGRDGYTSAGTTGGWFSILEWNPADNSYAVDFQQETARGGSTEGHIRINSTAPIHREALSVPDGGTSTGALLAGALLLAGIGSRFVGDLRIA